MTPLPDTLVGAILAKQSRAVTSASSHPRFVQMGYAPGGVWCR